MDQLRWPFPRQRRCNRCSKLHWIRDASNEMQLHAFETTTKKVDFYGQRPVHRPRNPHSRIIINLISDVSLRLRRVASHWIKLRFMFKRRISAHVRKQTSKRRNQTEKPLAAVSRFPAIVINTSTPEAALRITVTISFYRCCHSPVQRRRS